MARNNGELPPVDKEVALQILNELGPTAGDLLNRHKITGRKKAWYPHEHVPYDLARNYNGSPELWTPDHILPIEVVSALYVGLLTEDNLPYYFNQIEQMMGGNEAFAVWNRQWTAEEGRHAIAIREYLHAARLINPWLLEEGRMAQMSGGEVPDPPTVMDGIVYVSLQELATRISHQNTGNIVDRVLQDTEQGRLDDEDITSEEEIARRLTVAKAGKSIMSLVAGDENRHYAFYSQLVRTALEIDRSTLMGAIERQVRNFAMPGEGIPDFEGHAKKIAEVGVYNLQIHYEQVLVPALFRLWGVDKMSQGLTDQAKRAQEMLMRRVEIVRRGGEREAQLQADRAGADAQQVVT